MNKKRVAFFIRAYNDVDHFIPLIAEFVKRNENPVVVLNTDIEFETDYRVIYLATLGEFEIHREVDFEYMNISQGESFISKVRRRVYYFRRNRKSFFGKFYRKFFFDCSKQMDFLRSRNITSCVFEWSTPFARGEVVERYFYAARGIGITTFAIPHGCNIFINSDVTIGYRNNITRGNFIDQSDTQYFDYYIFQNPIRRDGWIKWGFNPYKTQAWGSLRFDPNWSDINRNICPKFNPGKGYSKKLKVVFMQFQKEYNVKNELVLDTLKKISRLDGVALAVKDATREGKEFYDKNTVSGELGHALIGWYGNEVHSPSLIDWADCVIVIGGSIGVEVILQNKHLVYPLYLNTNRTMYEYFDAAFCAHSFDEIKHYINNIRIGKDHERTKGAGLMLREIIYAGEDEFDVPLKYYKNISSDSLNY
jgi:hypothetical protein